MTVWTKILQIYELSDIDPDCTQYFIGSGAGGGDREGCSPPPNKNLGGQSPHVLVQKHTFFIHSVKLNLHLMPSSTSKLRILSDTCTLLLLLLLLLLKVSYSCLVSPVHSTGLRLELLKKTQVLLEK